MSWKERGKDKNPIRGLIFDAGSKRGFALTRPKPEDKDQRPMYFELGAPLAANRALYQEQELTNNSRLALQDLAHVSLASRSGRMVKPP